MDTVTISVLAAAGGLFLAEAVACAVLAVKLAFERRLREQERASAEALRVETERRLAAFVGGALEQFKTASNDALRANGAEFKAKSAGELEGLLKPLKEALVRYEDEARKSQKKADELEVRLGEHMRRLGAAAERFDTGSTSFVNAITGGNKVAGNWGEAVLDQILAACDLVKDVHYIAQGGGTGNIPDYQVFDASSRRILVIDSKVSWKKFKEMSESADPAVRAAALREHIASIRSQIDVLSSKEYFKNPNPPRPGYEYLPFAAMFVPSDAALWEAVKADPSIPAYAYRRNVVLVTPTSVFGFMKLVHEGWALYSAKRNQEKIAAEAKLLVERVDRLFRALEEADAAAEKTREKLAAALKLASVEAEGQCIKGPALRIIRLGGAPEKPLKSRELTSAGA